LLARIDQRAAARSMTRSAFLAEAAARNLGASSPRDPAAVRGVERARRACAPAAAAGDSTDLVRRMRGERLT
jgi:hypothetical protein